MPKKKLKVAKKAVGKAVKKAKSTKVKVQLEKVRRKSARELLREKALLESKQNDPFVEDVEKESFNTAETLSDVEKEIDEGVEDVDETEIYGTGHLEDDVQGEEEDEDDY